MSDSTDRAARWLLAVVLFLIVYGSLFPFGFTNSGAGSLGEALARLSWARTTRSDVAANVLLYLPFGACLGWMLAARLGGPIATVLSALAGLALSTGIEVAQVYETRRVASLSDVFFNGVGSLSGAIVALALRSARQGLRRHRFARVLTHPFAASLLILWVGYRLAPFALELDPSAWREALLPLASGPWFDLAGLARYLLPWLIVGQALRTVQRGDRVQVTLLATMAGLLAGLIVVSGKALVAVEIVAMALALPLGGLLGALGEARSALLLAFALAVMVVVDGLAPFDFALDPAGFGFIPFEGPLVRYRATNLGDMFQKCFTYGALVWLLARSGQRVLTATLLAAVVVFAVELLQVWLPGRSADITDPLLVFAAGGLLAMFEDQRSGPSFASR